MSDLFDTASKVLSSKFCYTENFVKASTISLLTGQNVMFYGPGGYAKTEMILSFLSIFCEDTIASRMLECSPDTTVSSLLGGATALTTSKLDKDSGTRVETTKESIDFNKGPLRNHFYFLEELLDAPLDVLAALKSLMTNKQWDGEASQNLSFLSATNVNPYELLKSAPEVQKNSYEAFLQRWMVIGHNWETHEVSDYINMIESGVGGESVGYKKITKENLLIEQSLIRDVKMTPEDNSIIAQICTQSAGLGKIVSPRTFNLLRRAVRTSAYLADRGTINDSDLGVLRYYGSIHPSIISDLESSISSKRDEIVQKAKLEEYQQTRLRILRIEGTPANNLHKFNSISHHLTVLYDKLGVESFSDSFQKERGSLLSTLEADLEKVSKQSVDCLTPIAIPED